MSRQPMVRAYMATFRVCVVDAQRADDLALHIAEQVALELGARFFVLHEVDELGKPLPVTAVTP